MKKPVSRILCSSMLLTLTFFASCKMGRPPRKMLPDDVTGTQSTIGMPFYYTDTLVSQLPFFAVKLPCPQYDSVLLGLATSYQSMPGAVFAMLRQQGKKGAVIDVRSGSRYAAARSTITIQMPRPTNASATVIFLWDDNSAYRAAAFMDMLKQVRGITYFIVTQQAEALNKQGCFEKSKPGF